MFKVNEVLRFEKKLFRILQVLPQQIVWICLDNEKAMPRVVLLRDLISAFDDESLTRADDPFSNLAYEVPEKGSTAQIKRDGCFELIKDIVFDSSSYDPHVRASKINKLITEGRSSKPTLYKLLRRYWQRGQTPNALLPDYKNSGAKGKKRKGEGNKLGRPRKYTPGVGAVVDDQVERLFRTVIDRYLLKDRGVSIPYTHRRFAELYKNYYPDIPESEIPTKWQMLHFYKREYSQVETLKKRTSPIEYNKDTRPLNGTANSNVLGPGARFEIDATIADIYLVSDSDRGNIVGRPVIYMVIDVFSRMVAGFYVGFESPSYAAAMQALSVAMTDKVQWCDRLGFEGITYEDWPIVGLPNAILADRGELLGHQIESLESSFAVRIENTPPYRGMRKELLNVVSEQYKQILSRLHLESLKKLWSKNVVEKIIVWMPSCL